MYRRMRWKDEHNAQHTSTAEVVYRIRCEDDHTAQHISTTEIKYRRMWWKDDHNALCLCECGLFLDTASIWKITWNSFWRKWLCYGLESPGFKSRQEQEIFVFSKLSRMALGVSPRSVQKLSGFYVVGVKRRGMKFATYLHLVPRLRMSGVVPPLHLSGIHGAHRGKFILGRKQLLLNGNTCIIVAAV